MGLCILQIFIASRCCSTFWLLPFCPHICSSASCRRSVRGVYRLGTNEGRWSYRFLSSTLSFPTYIIKKKPITPRLKRIHGPSNGRLVVRVGVCGCLFRFISKHIRCRFDKGHTEVCRMWGCSHYPGTLHHTIHHCPAVV